MKQCVGLKECSVLDELKLAEERRDREIQEEVFIEFAHFEEFLQRKFDKYSNDFDLAEREDVSIFAGSQ